MVIPQRRREKISICGLGMTADLIVAGEPTKLRVGNNNKDVAVSLASYQPLVNNWGRSVIAKTTCLEYCILT
jgi:hypothetical protein